VAFNSRSVSRQLVSKDVADINWAFHEQHEVSAAAAFKNTEFLGFRQLSLSFKERMNHSGLY
jgi:hypothetical protein